MEDYFFIESLGELLEAVQRKKVFKDSKLFVDSIPKENPALILQRYRNEKDDANFDLKSFVLANFIVPELESDSYRSENKPILEHLEELWDVLTREPQAQRGGTLIALPHPYVVPGGRFREIYYWDSYFTMLGLKVSNRTNLLEDMVRNFAWMIDQFGFIPNGNRTYYLGRSQPPFFSLMVTLLASEKGDDVLIEFLPQLLKEYAFWMDGAEKLSQTNRVFRRVVMLSDGSILNRYWDDRQYPRPEALHEDSSVIERSGIDPEVMNKHLRAACESGWDFSSRWMKDGSNMVTLHTADVVPVDLNCLLFHLEQTIANIGGLQKDEILKSLMNQRKAHRLKAIEKYCWDDVRKFYFDYDHVDRSFLGKFSLAAVYPLFCKIADQRKAKEVAAVLADKFLFSGGLVTTPYHTGQQWDYPNGWAPLQWMAFTGLRNYGLDELASAIKERWTSNCERVYRSSGKMTEKYDVVNTETNAGGGEYPNQDGFGWTNGVYLAMMASS